MGVVGSERGARARRGVGRLRCLLALRAAALLAAGLGAALHGPGAAARPAAADEAARPAWASALEALRLERDPARSLAQRWALLAQQPAPAALLAELARPLPWAADAKRGMVSWEQPVEGAPAQTVFAFVPSGYTPARAWPVLLWLHGAVSRDEDGGGMSGLGLREEAEAKGFLLLSPSGTARTAWWTPAGVAHVRAALRELALRYRVDADRVAVMGFSDGGSGCYHLLSHAPDAFACFVPLMGNPLVTRLAGGPAFACNSTAGPVLAMNGGRDALYPSAQMGPLLDELRRAGARIEWLDLPDAQHNPQDAFARSDDLLAFTARHVRTALPAEVDWECVLPAIDGRRAWVEILRLDPAAPGAADLASTRLEAPAAAQRPRLGISLDAQHEGPGVRVETVQDGTPAAEAGFRPGDVIVKVGDDDLPEGAEAARALRAYLDTLQDRDGAFTVQRGEATEVLTTRPRVLAQDEPPAALGYGLPSGRVRARVTGPNQVELTTRGVAAVRLHLARPLFDLAAPVVVRVNGQPAWQGLVRPDAAYALDSALRRLPGDPAYAAVLTLPVR